MKYITASQIIQINASITGVEPDANKQVKINSVFSSVDYYDTVEEQLASIMINLASHKYDVAYATTLLF
mgnify:CR=1 FL=1